MLGLGGKAAAETRESFSEADATRLHNLIMHSTDTHTIVQFKKAMHEEIAAKNGIRVVGMEPFKLSADLFRQVKAAFPLDVLHSHGLYQQSYPDCINLRKLARAVPSALAEKHFSFSMENEGRKVGISPDGIGRLVKDYFIGTVGIANTDGFKILIHKKAEPFFDILGIGRPETLVMDSPLATQVQEKFKDVDLNAVIVIDPTRMPVAAHNLARLTNFGGAHYYTKKELGA